MRIVAHALRNLWRHEIPMRAAGLTLVSLFALVPLVALVFGVANGLGYGELLERAVDENTRDLPPKMLEVVEQVRALVSRTSFGALGGVSTLVLAWSALSLFGRVEQALNHTWHAVARRSWLRRATDFIALIVAAPLLLVGAFVSSSALKSAAWIGAVRDLAPWLGDLYDMGLGAVPHAMAWIAFAALYKYMPGAQVRWRSALVAGIATGSAMLFVFGVYLHFQIGTARMNAIYATLAALPLLLVYLQVAWTIVLLGAEVSYGLQNLHVLGPDRSLDQLNQTLRERLALRLVASACESFDRGGGPVELARLASELDVPREWLDAVASELDSSGVLALARGRRIVPARPGRQISVHEVLAALRGELSGEIGDRLALPETLGRTLAEVDGEVEQRLGATRFDMQ